MKLSMHNWMRYEPIEVTIKRLARFGFDAIEISGEPARYDRARVRALLDEHGIACSGSVTLMTGGRDLIHEDAYVRYGTVKYMKDCIDLIAALGGEILCIVPSTVGKIVPMAGPAIGTARVVERNSQQVRNFGVARTAAVLRDPFAGASIADECRQLTPLCLERCPDQGSRVSG